MVVGAIEGYSAYNEIKTLNAKKMANRIDKNDYYREVTKCVAGATGATLGSVGGGVIGQALCPVPVLGYIVGCYLGNSFGRWFGSVSSGQVYDFCCRQ